ncbi:MAG: nucleotidyltransferase domain-containing protein [Chloroflexota bacterium]
MIALIEERRDDLLALCERFHVRRLALFGSAATGELTLTSDLDFAVEFEPLDCDAHKDSYFGLLFALEDLFGRPADLVEYGPIRNPYFRRALADSEVLLYAAA